ncbi:hypothetical protein RRG08_031052 [Elysia crispata]|uniref:Uncharacterized protein n=1 Tax=Elysia crispata TaxID=231223 RepID=A0AAE0ZFA4_9GAST|nr:hypothetical protein RRG08_031052 [Elysia crispata]
MTLAQTGFLNTAVRYVVRRMDQRTELTCMHAGYRLAGVAGSWARRESSKTERVVQ